jgi:hypothetical protein
MLCQEGRVARDDYSAQLPPWKHEEAIGAIRIGWCDLNHHTNEIWIGVGELPLNDLLSAVKRDFCKLPDVCIANIVGSTRKVV